jgi:hypothetical protein
LSELLAIGNIMGREGDDGAVEVADKGPYLFPGKFAEIGGAVLCFAGGEQGTTGKRSVVVNGTGALLVEKGAEANPLSVCLQEVLETGRVLENRAQATGMIANRLLL